MPKLNPKKALDAIISKDIIVETTSGPITIKPISISTIAVLDSIGSPILNESNDANMINMMSTLYICLNGYKAAFTSKTILEDALEYFDKLNLTNEDFDKIREAVLRQFEKVLNIQPQQSEKKS
jgi:hypothetical protein